MNWQVQNNFALYDDMWQRPARTEEFAAKCLQTTFPKHQSVSYLGFPWATLIDMVQTSSKEKTAQMLYDLSKRPRPIGPVVISVCQHIFGLRYLHYMRNAGVTDLFWTHATKTKFVEGGVRIHPFPLYPVQCEKFEWEFDILNHSTALEKQYLFSFIGAYDGAYYISEARRWIFELAPSDRAFVSARDGWHYADNVYGEQIGGKAIGKERRNVLEGNATQYAEVLRNSLFSLCPSGSGPNSIRLWESLGMGAIPVILADTLRLPGDRKLWEQSCVFISERKDAIDKLPATLAELARDPARIHSMQDGCRQLWFKYGFKYFPAPVLSYCQKVVSLSELSALAPT